MVVNNIIIKKKLLRWYDLNRRILPWRVRNNKKIDPYKVLISEIMLQQTTVNTVINKYIKFLDLWPNLNQLSKTSESKLLKFWSGDPRKTAFFIGGLAQNEVFAMSAKGRRRGPKNL